MDAIKDIRDELNRLKRTMQAVGLNTKEVLTLEEAAIYTGRSRSNLHKLTSARAIPHSKPTGKMICFERRKLDEWMLQNPVKTAAEIEQEAATYVVTNSTSLNRGGKRSK